MITVGVDLAADSSRTAAVAIEWAGGRAVVTALRTEADDDAIVELCGDGDGDGEKVGIDCPLGWPDAFVEFVGAHRDGTATRPAETIAQRRRLVYRETDLVCREHGLRPLSVSADRIGHAALRAAGLLARLGETDRSGAGRAVETYPAGSLKRWGLPHRRYKDDPALLLSSLAALQDGARLSFAHPADQAACARSDHAFDAVVCALTARAAALAGTTAPSRDQLAVARREGWIHLPTCELSDLDR